ncbi:hypothetical protein E2C01_062477 [Portunus trituberculatus]|uniref:Uncharacterized protein n=1 Tax=Portunus trituberculatus TaxID=210409 RepID=A0A5B7HET1_PORTR|nr:hypothetical protein [Portunus trituberculatus]
MCRVDGPQPFALPVDDVNYHHSYGAPDDEERSLKDGSKRIALPELNLSTPKSHGAAWSGPSKA